MALELELLKDDDDEEEVEEVEEEGIFGGLEEAFMAAQSAKDVHERHL